MINSKSNSIRKRLRRMSMLASSSALVLACAGFVLYELMAFRMEMVRELTAQAQIVGSNSVSSLMFEDRHSAEATLAALSAERSIVSAGLYDRQGNLFAGYHRKGDDQSAPVGQPSETPGRSYRFENRQLFLSQAIVFEGERVGTVYIQSDLEAMYARLWRYALIAAIVLVASLLLAFLISTRLQGPISRTVLNLAETAQEISSRKDYSVRAAPSETSDELALLTETFNGMLSQIEARDEALERARHQVELRVQERTAELEAAHAELDRFFDISADMLCIAGFDGHFKRINPAWERTLGFSQEELLSRPFTEFIHPEDEERTIREADRLTTGTEMVAFENRYLCKDGSYKPLSWRATPLPGQRLFYAAARDISVRKKAEQALVLAKEEAEQANKFKDQFLSTMSHELRTPLNAILGFSELLRDDRYGVLTDRQRRYLDHVHSGGRHLLRLINDILDLSKIAAGRMGLDLGTVIVQEAFEQVAGTLGPLADKKSQTLARNAAPGLVVRADPNRLNQILLNLVGNAIKFSPEQGRIELQATAVDGHVRIDVKDNGPGIPAEEQRRIFEAFQRLSHPGKATEGTGLGLAIAQRLVELHGGRLDLESAPGQGCCFYFNLPEASPAPKQLAVSQPAVAGQVDHPRVLVIDDDPSATRLLESQLTPCGYDVVICNRPQDALEMAAELQPNVITIDLLMKPTTGWDLLLELRFDPRTREIPLIVVSILDSPGKGAAFIAEEYLRKPVEKSTLLAAIARCLKRRGLGSPMEQSILVVEDDDGTREMIHEALSAEGYRVALAADGEQAYDLVRSTLPSLVILDLLLPRISGLELLTRWKADPRTAGLPVFVLTGKDLTAEEQQYLRTNVESLMHKQSPWQENLLSQLRSILKPSNGKAPK